MDLLLKGCCLAPQAPFALSCAHERCNTSGVAILHSAMLLLVERLHIGRGEDVPNLTTQSGSCSVARSSNHHGLFSVANVQTFQATASGISGMTDETSTLNPCQHRQGKLTQPDDAGCAPPTSSSHCAFGGMQAADLP